MGTINYKTSDYITIGIYPLDYETEEEREEAEIITTEAYKQTADILDNYDIGTYYHIDIESGYYEGFYIDIENNYGIAYNDYYDKREAQKEITQIKKCLFEIVDTVPEMVAVFPGWCTSYATKGETKTAIKEAVAEMREEAKAIPTWYQYEHGIYI